MDRALIDGNDIQVTGDGIRIGDTHDTKNTIIKDNYVVADGTNLVRTTGQYTNLTVSGNVTEGYTQEF